MVPVALQKMLVMKEYIWILERALSIQTKQKNWTEIIQKFPFLFYLNLQPQKKIRLRVWACSRGEYLYILSRTRVNSLIQNVHHQSRRRGRIGMRGKQSVKKVFGTWWVEEED